MSCCVPGPNGPWAAARHLPSRPTAKNNGCETDSWHLGARTWVGTWPSPPCPPGPHTGACPCPFPSCSRAPGACRLYLPVRYQPPFDCSSAPAKGARVGQMAHQGADDRCMPTSGEGKLTALIRPLLQQARVPPPRYHVSLRA